MSSVNLAAIVAFDEQFVIGRNGQLPWRLSADLRRFKRITMGGCLLMGRRTYESIGRPLPGRTTIVLTSRRQFDAPGCLVASDLPDAIAQAKACGTPFVVGGADVYRQALSLVRRLYVTRVHARIADGDAHFPAPVWSDWTCVESERHEADERNEYPHTYEIYDRVDAPIALNPRSSSVGKS